MKKHALIIGINRYDNDLPALSCAVKDAKEIAGVLRMAYGFSNSELTLMTCEDSPDSVCFPTRENILKQLNNVPRGQLDRLLVFFCGHGFGQPASATGYDRYLCPVDANKNSLHNTGLSLREFAASIKAIGAMDTCLVLDCCQNPPPPPTRSTAPAFSKKDTAFSKNDDKLMTACVRDIHAAVRPHQTKKCRVPTTILLSSCSPGECAYEWAEKGHGIFTFYLLEAMKARKHVTGWLSQITSESVYNKAQELHREKQQPNIRMVGGCDIDFTSSRYPISILFWLKHWWRWGISLCIMKRKKKPNDEALENLRIEYENKQKSEEITVRHEVQQKKLEMAKKARIQEAEHALEMAQLQAEQKRLKMKEENMQIQERIDKCKSIEQEPTQIENRHADSQPALIAKPAVLAIATALATSPTQSSVFDGTIFEGLEEEILLSRLKRPSDEE